MRAIAYVSGDEVRLVSRNDKDMAGSYPELAVLARRVEAPAILDGEIVALATAARTSGCCKPACTSGSRRHGWSRRPGPAIPVRPAALRRRVAAGLPVHRAPGRLEDLGLDPDPVRTPPWYRDDAETSWP